tara:strand:- start:2960 stop:4939 length:1980 start_codon:yes stop_codon:yes gene_type:complete
MQEYSHSALVEIFFNENGDGILQKKKYADIIDTLRPDSTFTLNVLNDNIYDYFTMEKTEFKDIIQEAVFNSLQSKYGNSIDVNNTFRNLKINFVSNDVTKMHNLNAREHEQAIITVECEVIAVEKEKSFIKKCVGTCPLCYKSETITADIDRDIENTTCANIRCKRQKLKINKTGLITDNLQYMYLQEMLNDANHSSPIIIKGVAVGDLSGKIHIGQKKRIVGMYKSVIDPKKNEHEILIEIISAEPLEEKAKTKLTSDEIDHLVSESKKEGFLSKITTSFAPLIIGYEDVKFSILLMLAGGYSNVKRGDINILLVGDPSLAKSELLKECSKISNKSMYTSGKGSSAAGLTIGLVKMESGNFVAQAGVLPLCDNGHACIDEFDKMSTNDRSSMHEGMEQQTVSIAKAGFRMTLEARTSILAAANPKYGKYDGSMSLIDNIDIPVPLVSRFDLIWLLRDTVNATEDNRKAKYILDTFTGKNITKEEFLKPETLSAYLNYIRKLEPEMTDEAKSKLVSIYGNMRSLSTKNDSLAIGVRQLEALARMSTAHAKLLFKPSVEISDVLAVEELLKKMFGALGLEMDSGFSQTSLLIGKKESKDQLANRVWAECEDGDKCVRYSKFISKLAESDMFDDSSAKVLFAKWESMCHIKMKGDGVWQKN